MSYPKSVLKSAMERLIKRREQNKELTEKRRKEIYIKYPEIAELNKRISEAMLTVFKGASPDSIKKELYNIENEKRSILMKAGLGENALEEIHTCPICSDEGFYKGAPCVCYLKLIKEEAYKLSNLEMRIEKENFQTYDESLFSNKDVMLNQKEDAKRYCALDGKMPKNLIFTGGTGTGKTFLSSCIAKEFLDNGFSVLYLSASKLASVLEDRKFGRGDAEFNEEYVNFIHECDLLIIDDLGTEYAFGYSQSLIFDILEERTINGKRNVLSTNLSLGELSAKYSPRFYSRLMQDYKIILFKGEDLRTKGVYQK